MVIGLDISLDKIAVCVLAADGRVVWQGKVSCEPDPLIGGEAVVLLTLRWLHAVDREGGTWAGSSVQPT